MAISQRLKSKLFDIFVYCTVIVITILMFYPFLYIVSVSLSAPSEIHGANITFYPKGFSFELYKLIFQLPTVYTGYLNSLIYTIVGTAFSITLAVLCAYPLSKPWLYKKDLILIFIVITMFVQGGLIPLYIVVKMLGMYNTMWAIILPFIMNSFYMFIALSFFKGIPIDLEEASYIDGAGDIQILLKVFLPLSKPILATLSLFYAVFFWNSWFPAAIFLSDAAKYPIQLVVKNFNTGTGISPQEMTMAFGATLKNGEINIQALNYALIVVVILPILILYPFVQKYFVKGAMIGSLKG